MKVKSLKNTQINQNGYHKNILTKERIGTLFVYPTDFTPDDCLSCDGYSLQISDYEDLYNVIGTKFNQSDDLAGTFRIPDYNISKRFLQPSDSAGLKIEAGLPNITGTIGAIGLSGSVYTGAFYFLSKGGTLSNSGEPDYTAGFDASICSEIYGKSDTVQPPSQTVHICIKYR